MDKIYNRIGQVVEAGRVEFLSSEIVEVKPNQILIRIVSSAVCGSDLHIFKGKHPSVPLPITIGHEFSGDIVEVGDGISKFEAGQRVTVEPVLTCGICDACRKGDYGYCEEISFTYRNGQGAMAKYIVVNEDQVFPLPDYLSYDSASLIEPLSVAVHAVKRADIKLGERVLVLGAGAIGLLITAVCKRSGASEIIVVDRAPHKLAMAKSLGATEVINSAETDPLDFIIKSTNGKGIEKSFECVGVQETFFQAIMSLCKNGLATIVGIFEDQDIKAPVARFVTHEIRVQGSQGYCWDFPTALKLSGEIDLESLITHTFTLDNLQEALETCLDANSKSIKVIVKP